MHWLSFGTRSAHRSPNATASARTRPFGLSKRNNAKKEASRNTSTRVAAALAEDGKQARVRGFAAFLELSASLRARVRTLAAQPVLEWLEMMDVRGVRTAAAVEAGVVLENIAAMSRSGPGDVGTRQPPSLCSMRTSGRSMAYRRPSGC